MLYNYLQILVYNFFSELYRITPEKKKSFILFFSENTKAQRYIQLSNIKKCNITGKYYT